MLLLNSAKSRFVFSKFPPATPCARTKTILVGDFPSKIRFCSRKRDRLGPGKVLNWKNYLIAVSTRHVLFAIVLGAIAFSRFVARFFGGFRMATRAELLPFKTSTIITFCFCLLDANWITTFLKIVHGVTEHANLHNITIRRNVGRENDYLCAVEYN